MVYMQKTIYSINVRFARFLQVKDTCAIGAQHEQQSITGTQKTSYAPFQSQSKPTALLGNNSSGGDIG